MSLSLIARLFMLRSIIHQLLFIFRPSTLVGFCMRLIMLALIIRLWLFKGRRDRGRGIWYNRHLFILVCSRRNLFAIADYPRMLSWNSCKERLKHQLGYPSTNTHLSTPQSVPNYSASSQITITNSSIDPLKTCSCSSATSPKTSTFQSTPTITS